MQVHHPFGIKRNPFVTQLLAYDKNFKEFRPREAVIPDIKKAKTFGEKRKVFETFVKKSDPKVLTAPDKESRVKRRRQNIGRKTGGATSLEEKLQVMSIFFKIKFIFLSMKFRFL